MRIKFILFFLLIVLFSCKKETKEVVLISAKSIHETIPVIPEIIERTYKVETVGDTLDVFNDVYVFYNKSMTNTSGRNVSNDGYNIGLKWQCVEFVKRYYYEHLNHKMPNSYGHAKDFYNSKIGDGQLNPDRNLLQFTNKSQSKPEVNDLLVFDGNLLNPYGHVAIISKVEDGEIEIVQQNVGKNSRDTFNLVFDDKLWKLKGKGILGWLRKK
jgi:surface antigen